jgi:hypothetical protein
VVPLSGHHCPYVVLLQALLRSLSLDEVRVGDWWTVCHRLIFLFFFFTPHNYKVILFVVDILTSI